MPRLYVWKRIALGLHVEFGSIGLNAFGAGSLAVGPLKSASVCSVLNIMYFTAYFKRF